MGKFAYADASALTKLFLDEPETAALRQFLNEVPDVVSSSFARVEVHRALRRAGATDRTRVSSALRSASASTRWRLCAMPRSSAS